MLNMDKVYITFAKLEHIFVIALGYVYWFSYWYIILLTPEQIQEWF